jgi:DNA-binding MarR family transcriptional regulator
MVNLDAQVGYILKQAQSLLHLRMEEALRPLDLTVTEYSCLHHVRREPGISAAALARGAFVTRQSMNATLQRLLGRDLVERPSQADSGRALPAVLTHEGESTLDAAQVLVDEVQERMLSGLSEPERVELARAIAACVTALEN